MCLSSLWYHLDEYQLLEIDCYDEAAFRTTASCMKSV